MFAVLRALWLVVRANPGGVYALVARAAAEGALGSGVQRIYRVLAGRKTKIGIVVGATYLLTSGLCKVGLLASVSWCALASWLGDASMVLLGLGVLDASLRAAPPKGIAR